MIKGLDKFKAHFAQHTKSVKSHGLQTPEQTPKQLSYSKQKIWRREWDSHLPGRYFRLLLIGTRHMSCAKASARLMAASPLDKD